MSFLDQLGKQITDLGLKATSSSETFIEVSRLNTLISNIRQQLPQQYEELGKAYYDLFGDGSGVSQLQCHIDGIKASYAELDEYEVLILKAKGFLRCPSCGAEISADSSFCSNCGAKIVHEEPQPAAQTCPQCGAAVGENDLFCMNCGTSFISLVSNEVDKNQEIKEE